MVEIWHCLKPEIQVKLAIYQAKHYPKKLFNPPVWLPEIENLEQIDHIMKSPPGPEWRKE